MSLLRHQSALAVLIVLTTAACSSSSGGPAPGSGPVSISPDTPFSWSAPQDVDPANGDGTVLDSVSCAAETSCVALDDHGMALTSDGRRWSAPHLLDVHAVDSVSCPSTAFCLEAEEGGAVRAFDGHRWSAAKQIDPAISAKIAGDPQVSCTSSSFCVYLDPKGNALTYDGRV